MRNNRYISKRRQNGKITPKILSYSLVPSFGRLKDYPPDDGISTFKWNCSYVCVDCRVSARKKVNPRCQHCAKVMPLFPRRMAVPKKNSPLWKIMEVRGSDKFPYIYIPR
jgi:hypothetical protein